ncbi:class F sortase [Streptomyces sp. NPDC054796]
MSPASELVPDTPDGEPRTSARSRLTTGVAWAVLLLGLWLWGRELTEGGRSGAVFGDDSRTRGAAAGTEPLPAAHDPLPGTPRPVKLRIGALGVRAPVIARGVDGHGGIAAPPYSRPGLAGWYGAGPVPGARGAALIVGHVDTERHKAVFYGLSSADRGTRIEVTRSDGTVAEFTVERTKVVRHEDFDAREVYGPAVRGRSELRLLTCGGAFDHERRAYTSNVVVSAYLTGSRGTPADS